VLALSDAWHGMPHVWHVDALQAGTTVQATGHMQWREAGMCITAACRSCGHVSSVTDSFTHLSLDLPPASTTPLQDTSLAQLLALHFK
jgi:hypothetical protein